MYKFDAAIAMHTWMYYPNANRSRATVLVDTLHGKLHTNVH